MRLDKFLADSGLYSRKEASALIRSGRVTCGGAVVRDPASKVDEKNAEVCVDGESVGYTRFRYIMLNKPTDTISTTDDIPKSVMKLLPKQYSNKDMFPCGRLDIDTLGLLIITNDGQTAHKLLSPRHHCEKTYRFKCLPLTEEMRARLEGGVELSDFTSKPCKVELRSECEGEITVTEGKYHQIKRMFLAVGSEITYLERIKFGSIELDTSLKRGEWRELSEDELRRLLAVADGAEIK